MSIALTTGNLAGILYLPLRLVHLLHALLSRIFPPSPPLRRTRNIYVETLGLAGLFLFLFNINLVWDLHRSGETMLIIAFFLAARHWSRVLMRQPLFWLMIAFAVALVISTMIGMENLPESRHKSEALRMARLCLFVPLAWWIGSNIISIRNAFLVVCAGFIMASVPWLLDWNTLSALLEGRRAGQDITNLSPGDFGAWFGFFFLGFVILGRNLLPDWLKKGKVIFWGYLFFFFVLFILMTGLFVSQSRTTWIAVITVLPLGLIILCHAGFTEKKLSFKNFIVPALIFLLLFLFAASKLDVIKDRFSRTSPAVSQMLSGRFDQIEENSFGHRFVMYKWAMETESFVTAFGWGPRAIQAIGRNEELTEKLGWPDYGHLHSDSLATIFRTGIFGFSVFFLIYLFLARGAYAKYRDKKIPPAFYVFFVMLIVYAVIVGLGQLTFRIHAFQPVWMGLIFAAIINPDSEHGE